MKNTLILIIFLIPYSAFSQSSKKDFKALLKKIEGNYFLENSTSDPTAIIRLESVPIKIAFIENPVFYIKWLRSNGTIYRQRLYVFSYDKAKKQISSDAFSFKIDSLFNDFEKLKQLKQTDLKPSLGCSDIWQRLDNQFVGNMYNCKFDSERRGKPIFISSKIKINNDGWASTEEGKDENGKVLFGKIDEFALTLKRR